MEAEDVAEDENAAGGTVSEGDDLPYPAFHFGESFFNHGCLDHSRGLHADAGEGEFVDFGWNVGSRLIHRLGKVFTDDIDYEDSARFEVTERVFFVVARRLARWGEADDGRVAGDGVEEAVWGEIVGAILAHSRDPGDGSGHDHADHELVEVFGAGVFRFDDHRSAVFRLTLDWKE